MSDINIQSKEIASSGCGYNGYTESSNNENRCDQSHNDQERLQKQLVGRYQIIQKLGKGSQGDVFLAESTENHQKAAIKQLNIQSVSDWKQYELFHREADVLQQLNIPGVAKLYETIENLDSAEPMALIVQEYIEGESLQRFIGNGHCFQIDQIGDILLQLLDILDKLHHNDPQVVHRDIKPSNVLLNYRENSSIPEVHLIDFGAVSNPQVKGGGSTVVGTYGYMAPEQLMGKASAASDLYSLAIVAVYLLSGVPPEELEIRDYHVLIDSHLEHLPYAITAFLRKMLEPRIEERMTNYVQIREFLNALKNQRFDRIPKINVSFANNHYKLKNVLSYHQTGNIVLWEELEDAIPRSVPLHVYPAIFKITKFKLSVLFTYLIGVAVISILIILISNIPPEFDGYLERTGLTIIILIFFIFILIIGAVLIVKICGLMTYFPEEIARFLSHRQFLKHARKSMATVIRIEYLHRYEELKTDSSLLLNTYEPSWRITYRFNPPDDDSPDDLIRSVETHVNPDVRESDLIPILYRITEEGVYSAPYPIPVTDEFKPSMD